MKAHRGGIETPTDSVSWVRRTEIEEQNRKKPKDATKRAKRMALKALNI